MSRPLSLVGSLLFLAANAAVMPQEPSLEELLPGLKDRAVILDIVSRVVEQNQEEVWNSVNSRVTIPGRPVGLRLVGANVVVAVQFTPYFRRNGHSMLVAQGQIWVNVPNEGIRYLTTMQTIPIEFGEPIYFFPLGPADSQDDARIEIRLELRPYTAEDKVIADPPEPGKPESLPETEEAAAGDGE
ncbi:MAG: hypothetical protein LBC60_06695 [Spirochaetaceae bacterium]|jgi:hypothetical protein|nr:hypothetical protein [Spirochaetaceae bacterium]